MTDKKVAEFLDEIEQVCKKYGFTIGHEDHHGGFIIEPFDEYNIRWLRHASVLREQD